MVSRACGGALVRAHSDGDAKCALTMGRQARLVGRRGRGDYGGLAGKRNWSVVQRRWRAATVEYGGGNGELSASLQRGGAGSRE